MATDHLTAQRLRELLEYNPETGQFKWRVRGGNRCKKGWFFGSVSRGYWVFFVCGKLFFAHRLAWLYITSEWPKHHIDHINGIKADNRFTNLRDVVRSQNMENMRSARTDNLSCGLLGVTWAKSNELWKAQITVNRKNIHIGYFATPEDAHAAYVAEKRIRHIGGML